MKTISVIVTQDRIDRGGYTATDCPVYLAITEDYPELKVKYVKTTYIEYEPLKYSTLPKKAINWINNHDRFKRHEIFTDRSYLVPTPINFDLEVPE